MKSELPMESQAVQVKLGEGDWQSATYQDGQFVDTYGLPLDYRKITSWRAAGGGVNGAVSPEKRAVVHPISQRAH